MARLAVLLVLAALAGAAALRLSSNTNEDEREWKERPVTKVVNLLKDMQKQLEKEAAEDEELYDKLMCWCETNEKEKTKAIEIANQMITDLTALIEETAAKAATFTTEVEGLKKEVADNTKELAEATALREKEAAEFSTDEKDAIASITSLKGAVSTLSKHHEGSALLQESTLADVSAMLWRDLNKQPRQFAQAVAPHQRQALMKIMSGPTGMVSLLQSDAGVRVAAPASGEIFGILKQMKESFETNLETSRKDEATAVADFASMKAAKEQEIKASSEKAFNKEAEGATAVEKNAVAKDDLKNTRAALESDTNFLADLKKSCAVTDGDWEARSKMRQDEIAAVSDTIAMLTSDDNRDLFSSSLGLIQVAAQAQKDSSLRAKAVAFLAEAGKELKSQRVSYLAERMRFDPFGKLRESIDGMTGSLEKEKKDEIVHKDDCVTDFNANDKQTTERTGHKSDVEQEIASLETEITQLDEEEKRLKAEIAATQEEMLKASENREKENKEYQALIADQRATQEILKKAVDRLAAFYKAALVQRDQQPVPGAAVEPMPQGFGEYKKSSEGGGAMALIENIIADSAKVEKDAVEGEKNAQAAYETFMKDSNAEIAAKQKGITADEEAEAKDKIQESNDKTDKRETEGDLNNLGHMNMALHDECDFTLDNFEARQTAREGEVEALKQAKAIFSGAGFGR